MPHPFTWVPGERERHASTDPAPGLAFPAGQEIGTLCGRTVVAEGGVYPWLWANMPGLRFARSQAGRRPTLRGVPTGSAMKVRLVSDGDRVAHHSSIQLPDGLVLMLCGMHRHTDHVVRADAGERECASCAELATLPGPGRAPMRRRR